jgi:Domain of unknown function (DUF4266)
MKENTKAFGSAALLLIALISIGGCATVQHYERGNLADPIMAFQSEADEAGRELHWLEAREGSTGGAGGAGGGCACN